MSRRRSASPIPTMAGPWRWRICGIAACSTSWSPTKTDRCWFTKTQSLRKMSGSNSSWKEPPATAAQSALRSLFWNGQQQVQEVSGGSGFAAQNQRRLHFGLGKNPQIEKAVIRWPSGKVQTIDKPAADQLHKIKEPA